MGFYEFGRVVTRVFFKVFYNLRAEGVEHIPDEGGVILCSNHISTLDPPLIGTPLNRRIHFMAKAELFKIPLFKQLITALGAFPVKRGSVSKETIRYAQRLLSEGGMIGIFPEGTRGGGGMGKKGAASLALRTGAAVIPVAIIGSYRLFRPMKIVYGKPVDLSRFAVQSNSETLEEATELIMDAIRNLVQEHSN